MDGFAFDGKQLDLAPLKLRVVGTALAGKAWQGNVKTGECVKIMTGAVMPTGLDTVIAQELATVHTAGNETIVEIPAGILQAGDNRRKAGEDLQRGLPALRVGSTLSPAALGLVASLGIAKVKINEVYKEVMPFFWALMVVLALVTYVPWVSLGLGQWLTP
jgi:molybdopterin molybdotransferase